jgi:hypothetical protein
MAMFPAFLSTPKAHVLGAYSPCRKARAGFRRLPAGGDPSLPVVTHVRLHVGDDRRGIRAFGVQVRAGVVVTAHGRGSYVTPDT